MKCPKCQYISFDSNERCRNCGYEFTLTVDTMTLDLPIQTGDEAIGPFGDLALTDSRAPKRPAAPVRAAGPTLAAPRVPQPRPAASAFDLPLFKDRSIDEDAPLVTPGAAPRTPLSVRRSNPAIARGSARPATDEPELDLGLPLDSARDRPAPAPARWPASLPPVPTAPPSEVEDGSTAPAGAFARLLAAMLDGAILGSIGAAVMYFTLKVCGLQFSELAVLPPVPFATFLLLLGGGYFVLFTAAGGQTIGKMATGIKVVSMQGESPWGARVPLADSILRAVGYLVSVLPAGLGFLPALFGAERRAVHDRLAETRVVKA
jgi:uncharacterized RDD family membrane protein YckC